MRAHRRAHGLLDLREGARVSATVVIHCDTCHVSAGDWGSRTKAEALEAAKTAGWERRGRRDICWSCILHEGDEP